MPSDDSRHDPNSRETLRRREKAADGPVAPSPDRSSPFCSALGETV